MSQLLAVGGGLEATPTSVFWTNCTTDVVAAGMGHIDADNYFTVFKRRGNKSIFPPDVGFALNMFNWQIFQAEAGADVLGGVDNPFFFNAKLSVAENKLFPHAPSLSIGIFGVGTKTRGPNRTNQDIVYPVIGMSLPSSIGGRVFFGAFSGGSAMGKDRRGFMAAYTRPFSMAQSGGRQGYSKWAFSADYASGKNTIGGGGAALTYYFTPDISIETGPVWFNSKEINGEWKWSVQLGITIPVFSSR